MTFLADLLAQLKRMCHTMHQEDYMSDIVEIARFSSDFEARTVLARLNADGIDAKIVTDNAGGAFPSLTMFGGRRQVVCAVRGR
ncbi:MAG: hypothetical protein QGD91_08135 [Actinomycetota bacterium]|nr:hypothetical protein [Actinomycetota bacterium]MDK1097152.1 hypothetical protein [Actinomycetota bacterium]MDK1103076.1 hypothetical protein [Actinomycetota bacterium]